MLTLDTSGIVALIGRRQRRHAEARDALMSDPGPHLVPMAILAEVAYVLEARGGSRLLDLFLVDLQEGAYSLDCGEADLSRIRELMDRYGNLPLGLADAAVIACAERQPDPAVLTLDRRDFDVVAAEGNIRVVP